MAAQFAAGEPGARAQAPQNILAHFARAPKPTEAVEAPSERSKPFGKTSEKVAVTQHGKDKKQVAQWALMLDGSLLGGVTTPASSCPFSASRPRPTPSRAPAARSASPPRSPGSAPRTPRATGLWGVPGTSPRGGRAEGLVRDSCSENTPM